MSKKKSSMKRSVTFSSIITLIAFLYKVGLGVMSLSIILLVASVSTLLVFVCKVIFIKSITSTRDKKKKAYLFMGILAASFGVLFLLFAVLKVGGIDTSKKLVFTGQLGYIFVGFLVLMFILSIINLRSALGKSDIVVTGLMEMTFVSALADLVIIEEFVYKLILYEQNIPYLDVVNEYFPLGVAVLMLLVPLFMFHHFRKYVV